MRRGPVAISIIVVLLLVAGVLWMRGRGSAPAAPGTTDGGERTVDGRGDSGSTSRPRAEGSRRGGRTGRDAPAGEASAREPAGVTVDVVGAEGGERQADADPDGDEEEADLADLPMAQLGASLGIDTSMDDAWALEDEAAQWFGPMEADFDSARPLDPDAYKAILGNHHETATNVFKRSAEIGDELGPEKGVAFLEAYNELVDGYRREAYSTP